MKIKNIKKRTNDFMTDKFSKQLMGFRIKSYYTILFDFYIGNVTEYLRSRKMYLCNRHGSVNSL